MKKQESHYFSSGRVKNLFYSALVVLLIGTMSSAALGHSDLPTLLEDVNKDSVVNIQDLVLVASDIHGRLS